MLMSGGMLVNKWLLVLTMGLMQLGNGAYASPAADSSIALRNQMLNNLKGLNPANVLPGFTSTPQEMALAPSEGTNTLANLGSLRVAQDKAAHDVYESASQSHSVKPDLNSAELQSGSNILASSEAAPLNAACANGQCDSAADEASDDIDEGIVRLGAVSGSAEQVTGTISKRRMPMVFPGDAVDCKKYVLGIRDCCTDSGWGSWVLHCPSHLQALQRAKADNRVFYVGSYRKHKLDLDKHHVYCVFPSKLAGIVQLQGRANQLHIDFGKPKEPNCRGLTPDELTRINFKALDLSPLTTEFKNRIAIPNSSQQGLRTQGHIEQLSLEGSAHD